MKDIGFNSQNMSDREKVKVEDEMTNWKRNPVWVQTILVALVVFGFFMMNWSSISNGLTTMLLGVSGMRLVDMFTVCFVVMMVLIAYAVLVAIWTGGVTNKLLYAKIFKKRIMPYLGDDNVLRLFIPKTDKPGWWIVKNIGEFKVNKSAMFWFENGSLAMLTTQDHAEGVDINDIKEKAILKINPKTFENRNKEARLEGIEAANSPFGKYDMGSIVMGILILGIVAFLIMKALESNTCQSELVNLAQTCGEVAKAKYLGNDTVTSTTLAKGAGAKIISAMK